MKKQIKNYILISIFIISLVWIFRGYKIGEIEYENQKKEEIIGKIVKIYKPNDEKIIHIVFSDGKEYMPIFFQLNDLVQIGDSLIKKANTLRFVIYKKSVSFPIFRATQN